MEPAFCWMHHNYKSIGLYMEDQQSVSATGSNTMAPPPSGWQHEWVCIEWIRRTGNNSRNINVCSWFIWWTMAPKAFHSSTLGIFTTILVHLHFFAISHWLKYFVGWRRSRNNAREQMGGVDFLDLTEFPRCVWLISLIYRVLPQHVVISCSH